MTKRVVVYFLLVFSCILSNATCAVSAFTSVDKSTFVCVFNYADTEAPSITHTGLTEVNVLMNDVEFKAVAIDNFNIAYTSLCYSIYGSTYIVEMNREDSVDSFGNKVSTLTYTIPKSFFDREGILEYYIKVEDDAHITYWPSNGDTNPQVTTCTYSDDEPPIITHNGLTQINMLGEDIEIRAYVTENYELVSSTLYYTLYGESAVVSMTRSDSVDSYGNVISTISYTIPGSSIDKEGTLSYYIEVKDLMQSSFWPTGGANNPQVVSIALDARKTIGDEGGKITLNDGNMNDGETSIEIESGSLAGDETIIIKKISTSNLPKGTGVIQSDEPVAIYEFKPFGLKFSNPATVTLLYLDSNNDGIVERMNTKRKTSVNEDDLAAFSWDGIEWIYLGGTVDTTLNTVTVDVDRFPSLYGFAVFPVSVTKDVFKPKRRIITPALVDNINDELVFRGLNMSDNTQIKIYDITGNLIRTISAIPYVWDGCDDLGYVVENGVYIYQFTVTVNGKKELVSGTVAVAK